MLILLNNFTWGTFLVVCVGVWAFNTGIKVGYSKGFNDKHSKPVEKKRASKKEILMVFGIVLILIILIIVVTLLDL